MKRPILAGIAALLICSSWLPRLAQASIVEVQTVVGDFQINLYDNATPLTVNNFLNYVQNGGYTQSIFHRSVPGFIVQSGGFATDLNAAITAIPANPAVTNEPVFSNRRGTIAMAKVGGDPNSATSQWFINLVDNSGNLDSQNGGFTAFGEVVGNGMDVVDAIAALQRFNLGGALGEIPLRNYNGTDPVVNSHLIIVTAIIVTDNTVDSAGVAGLNPPRNDSLNTGGGTGGSGGGGGAINLLLLLGLLGLGGVRFWRNRP
jgi:peptidyl-prolyl cis-trans isomerase A (cyclophilin A)